MDKMLLIAGPCVIEEDGLTREIGQELSRQLKDLPVELYFKASFDKANRTSINSFRGTGMKEGLETLSRVKADTGLPLLTDFHTPEQAEQVADVVDFLQVPAFLCRQTEMIQAGVDAMLKRGKRLNVKKGQFLAPWDVKNIVDKVQALAEASGAQPSRPDWFTVTERGATHGYGHLVVDMMSFQCVQAMGVPMIYDATHSLQRPSAGPGGTTTGGDRQYLEVLARAAISAGADGVFMEVHPEPSKALSDRSTAFHLEFVGEFVRQLLTLREAVSKMPKLLPEAKS